MQVLEKITPAQLVFRLHDLIVQQLAVKGFANGAEYAQRHRKVRDFQLCQQESQRRTRRPRSGLVMDEDFRPVTLIDLDDFRFQQTACAAPQGDSLIAVLAEDNGFAVLQVDRTVAFYVSCG